MKILLTGASSFTGCWFAKTLSEAGHQVVATFSADSVDGYDEPLRKRRVETALGCCDPLWGVRFGDEAFIAAIRDGGFDLVGCHGAYVTGYRDADFDYARALASNTHNLPCVAEALTETGAKVVLTGTVFEGGEGAGSDGLPHFSAYGLSKSLTATAFKHCCDAHGVDMAKFVIPNPFGPLEEARFTAYLVRTWIAGETAGVRTPVYIRDNIHASLLAKAYAGYAEAFVQGTAGPHYGPSGYVESQGAFTERFAREMAPRLGVDCPVELGEQTDFPEPRTRINTDNALTFTDGWDESAAWDEMADYYLEALRPAG